MKQHTIIFVPHARARFRKFRLSTVQIATLVGLVLAVTVAGVFTTALYFRASVDREELARIEEENTVLRETNQRFEESVREMEGQLGDYQQRIHKLAIVAGIAELSPEEEAGIGGMEPLGAATDLDAEISFLTRQLEGLDDGMGALESQLDRRRVRISSTPAITPVKGILTSGFGVRNDPFTKRRAIHNGIDIVAPPRREVVASGAGIVTRAGRMPGLGNAVYVSHGFGLTTRYGHLSKVLVEPGQKVERGVVLGQVGNTGRATGYHLHYEVHRDGEPVNPLGFILDGTG